MRDSTVTMQLGQHGKRMVSVGCHECDELIAQELAVHSANNRRDGTVAILPAHLERIVRDGMRQCTRHRMTRIQKVEEIMSEEGLTDLQRVEQIEDALK